MSDAPELVHTLPGWELEELADELPGLDGFHPLPMGGIVQLDRYRGGRRFVRMR